MKILLGTNNLHKIEEMTRIINDFIKNKGFKIDVVNLNDLPKVAEPVEDGISFIENAMIKARYFYNIYKIPVICDDSGLVVNALDGKPGIFSARYAGNNIIHSTDELNRLKVLNELKEEKNRDANFTCSMVYYDGVKFINATKITEGYILEQVIGENGFGYDPIFYSKDLNKPLGLATNEEKDSISHRSRALNELLDKILA